MIATVGRLTDSLTDSIIARLTDGLNTAPGGNRKMITGKTHQIE